MDHLLEMVARRCGFIIVASATAAFVTGLSAGIFIGTVVHFHVAATDFIIRRRIRRARAT